jgi:hypothetical protein
LVILSHDCRKVLHFNVTGNPTASWAAQPIVEAFPYDGASKYLLRDNDSIYGQAFQQRVKSLYIENLGKSSACSAKLPRIVFAVTALQTLPVLVLHGATSICRDFN